MNGTDMLVAELNDRRKADKDEIAHLKDQIGRLAEVLIHEFPEGFQTTDGSEGACDMAIRLLRQHKDNAA